MTKKNEVRVNEPDYKLAASILRDTIATLRDDNAQVQGELSGAWKRVEKEAGVNKAAAKTIFSLINRSEANQNDFMRTFLGLAEAFGLYPLRADLVDRAEAEDEDGEEG